MSIEPSDSVSSPNVSSPISPPGTALSLPGTERLLSALKPGLRHAVPMPPGSGDAWLLADLARASGRPIVVFSADPLGAQRLADEIALRSEEHTSELQSLMRSSYAVFCLKK